MFESRTKIICTIGPATESRKMLKKLIKAGMDIARFNFSHGIREDHIETIKLLREISLELSHPVTILQDLSGPKIRIGKFSEGKILLKKGEQFILTARDIVGSKEAVQVNYKLLYNEVNLKTRILLDDGRLSLKVKEILGQDIICQVIVGGILSDNKGINLPNSNISIPALTEKDIVDMEAGNSVDVDYVAVSFVRTADDVEFARKKLKKLNSKAQIIAKLETRQAINNLTSILKAADGAMIARGDLGVEMAPEKVPAIQKNIIQLANRLGKPVITATQMLESMTTAARPTRAEASDVANAIYDGCDAVMLSGETSTGKYPVAALTIMDKIVKETEQSLIKLKGNFRTNKASKKQNDGDAICHAAGLLACKVKADVIAVFTQTGYSALAMSKCRPTPHIIAFTPNNAIQRRISLYWGVSSETMEQVEDMDDILKNVTKILMEKYKLKEGAKIILLLGWPLDENGITNLLRIYKLKKDNN